MRSFLVVLLLLLIMAVERLRPSKWPMTDYFKTEFESKFRALFIEYDRMV